MILRSMYYQYHKHKINQLIIAAFEIAKMSEKYCNHYCVPPFWNNKCICQLNSGFYHFTVFVTKESLRFGHNWYYYPDDPSDNPLQLIYKLDVQGLQLCCSGVTLNKLNCFKDYRRCIHILNHIVDLAWSKWMGLTLEHW